MIIDCDQCTLRDLACANCAVTFITSDLLPGGSGAPTGPRGPGGPAGLGSPAANGPAASPAISPATSPAISPADSPAVVGHGAELDAAELRAINALANAGMIPPLRYAPAMAKASLRGVVGYR
jgi:hypothetical protein